MAEFAAGEEQWIRRLGNLRNTVRQEMVRRQLAGHVRPWMSVLDVGCGQGTQAIAMAALGCTVTGVEPSRQLRELCARAASERAVSIELLDGTIEELRAVTRYRRFDVVCAHGLLMYMDDFFLSIRNLADRVTPAGLLSVTFRSGHALAMRPGLRRDWTGALEAFGTERYINELGVEARAHTLDEVVGALQSCGLEVVDWYGVRVFNDAVASDAEVPEHEDLAALLDAEDRAGRLDPYRILGSQLHVIARRI
ncbi:MAG TPA: methyltransferase domain-containing protein [Ilumatobacteraceae bacterium]|nr:methyltransferase domain-containing protein [Ilumatobacteraceae bacterium]HRB03818.1 methyltransferase domain-containing protein [Ilumatobacteraceae bacterium]